MHWSDEEIEAEVSRRVEARMAQKRRYDEAWSLEGVAELYLRKRVAEALAFARERRERESRK
jgi:hypothetical protein